jgi:hypothetical protein
VAGESTWMAADSFITGDANAHELELGATAASSTTSLKQTSLKQQP